METVPPVTDSAGRDPFVRTRRGGSMKAENSVEKLITAVLGAVLPGEGGGTALHEPLFRGREKEYLLQCIDSTFVSSVGGFVDRFEAMLADYIGVKSVVAVVNGTCALQVALEISGVRENDEVILPAMTFVATANAVSHCGAVPHFADCEPGTLGIDPGKLSGYLSRISVTREGECFNRITGRRIGAVVPMHVFGHPGDMDGLTDLCDRYGLPMVEDAAESLGSLYRGRHAGSFGRCAVLSFNGNKTVTTGGGGAVLTDDPELAARARHLTTTAKVPHRWEYFHDAPGYNYRMPNLNAALGCAQLEMLDRIIESKRRLAKRYGSAFADLPGVAFFTEPEHARSNYWLNALIVDREARDRVLSATNKAGYMTRPVWRLMHRLPMHAHCPRMDLSVAEDLEHRLINIPSGPGILFDATGEETA